MHENVPDDSSAQMELQTAAFKRILRGKGTFRTPRQWQYVCEYIFNNKFTDIFNNLFTNINKNVQIYNFVQVCLVPFLGPCEN